MSLKPFALVEFCGGGGASLGLQAAGYETLGIEHDRAIAELYQKNVGQVIVEDVSKINPYKLEVPLLSDRKQSGQLFILQTSPPCQDFSRANTKSDKSSDRANILRETYSHYKVLQPDVVILENVEDYAKSSIFFEFKNFLLSLNYQIIKGILNAADFGVAQSRRRLIMVGVRKGLPLPQITTTHEEFANGQLDLFGGSPKLPWVGWYEAIQDLLNTLPESKLTKKQKMAIGFLGHQTQLIAGDNSKSVISGYKTRAAGEPSFTLRCQSTPKAFLIDGQQKGRNGKRQYRDRSEPAWCLPTSINKGVPKALLIERVGDRGTTKTAQKTEPCWTLRAHLADDGKGGSRTKLIDAVLENAEVRSLNTRALARLQSFPDWYQWSGKNAIDMRAIGNSVPCLMAQKIFESVLASFNDLS